MYRKAKRNSSGDQESSLETLASSSPPLWHVLTQTPSRRASACASPWVRHRECVTACASPWVRHFASPPPPPTAGSPSAFSPRPQLQSLRRRLQGASRRCLPLSWELAPSVWPLRASHWRHVPTSWCMLPSALPVSGPPLLRSRPRWKGCPGSRKETGLTSRHCHATPGVREPPVWCSTFWVELICGIKSWRSQTGARIHACVFGCGRYTRLQ